MLSKAEDAGNPKDPAKKLEVRVSIQNNLSRLEHWLTSVKCNNQCQDLEIHMYKHKFIYRAAVRVQKAEESAGDSLMSQKYSETCGRGNS